MAPLLPIAEALTQVLARAPRLGAIAVPIAQAQGHILAHDLCADRDQPPFDRSAMDGVALRAADAAVGAVLPVVGTAAAGTPFADPLPQGACVRIFTGAVVPPEADSVVPVEQVTLHGDSCTLHAPCRPGQHVARQGSEVRAGGVVVAAGTVLTAARLGVAAAFGHAEVQVARRPRAAVVPTGDEVVAVTAAPGPGQIRDSNRYALAEILRQGGAEVVHMPVAADRADELHRALSSALRTADVIVTCGGVSAGDLDLVAPALRELGAEIHFHKIRIKPGKPLLFATIGDKVVLGLPGNPVSAAVCATLFALPLLAAMQGATATRWLLAGVPLALPLPATGPRDEVVPLVPVTAQGQLAVLPVATAGSADVFAFSRATWLGIRSAGGAALAAGESIDVVIWPQLP
ncbi:MAG: molybdopterin molybdotransferase MoeA [Deltaproteobacteria bacterium]|nr:molybdopterin molybdotransferase MoeA [Deltaproteobacteria bacterium]